MAIDIGGNKIRYDSNGNVVSVFDSEGNDITSDYIATHQKPKTGGTDAIREFARTLALNAVNIGRPTPPSGGSTSSPTSNTSQEAAMTSQVESQISHPSIPKSGTQTYYKLPDTKDQYITGKGSQIGSVTQVPQQKISAPDLAPQTEAQATQQTPVAPIDTNTVTATTVDNAAQGAASQGSVSPKALITDPVQGVISEDSLAVAAQDKMPREAYIQNQLASLLTGIEGGEVPAWAKPAVEIANADLASRGVGKSTVARDALFNAVIQAALPIASGDAATAQKEWVTNLNNKQQAVMFNASVKANMDLTNATYNQKAQVANAQAFLQMDFANLNNEQRTNEINLQNRQQVLLSDASAKNAADQFNAASENQTKQFMANLAASIDKANSDRQTSVSQFNAGQANQMEMYKSGNILEADKINAQLAATLSQFNSQLDFSRQQFNAQNALAIEQSNVAWRRQMNQINTAGVNATNQANAMNAFNLSNQALTMLWQQQRDNAQWVWQSSESSEDRANRIAIAAMSNEAYMTKLDQENSQALGGLAIDIWDRYSNYNPTGG